MKILISLLLIIITQNVFAIPAIQTYMVKNYPKIKGTDLDSCMTCHLPADSKFLNSYARDLKKYKYNFRKVGRLDSDKDGKSNNYEISHLRWPGAHGRKDKTFFYFENKKGLIKFNHADHILNPKYNKGVTCKTCHYKGGFYKSFNDDENLYEKAHKTCAKCHLTSGSERAPVKCSECHIIK